MIAWMKFIHVAAIAVWIGGLISLPGLYVQRTHVITNEQLFRLQRMVRFSYLRVLSPAAFVAVASGTALIFMADVFEPWLSAKLVLVGLLVVAHALTALVIIRLFRPGEVYPLWRFMLATFVMGVLVLGVLYFVLAKPDIDLAERLPEVISEPGALREFAQRISPWPIP